VPRDLHSQEQARSSTTNFPQPLCARVSVRQDDDDIIAQLRQKRIDEIKQARVAKAQRGAEVRAQNEL
jgi:hypothetical protein